jgi:hypothetical protein
MHIARKFSFSAALLHCQLTSAAASVDRCMPLVAHINCDKQRIYDDGLQPVMLVLSFLKSSEATCDCIAATSANPSETYD